MVLAEAETLYGIVGVAIVQAATIVLTVVKMRRKANGKDLVSAEERLARVDERCRRLEVDLEACTQARMILEADKHRLLEELWRIERKDQS